MILKYFLENIIKLKFASASHEKLGNAVASFTIRK